MSLGNAYQSHWEYAKAIEHIAQQLAIFKEVRDRLGEARRYPWHLPQVHLNVKAVAYLKAQHALAIRSGRCWP